MDKLNLPKSSLEVSKLILGTSKLHNLINESRMIDLLSCAESLGITHFDTSPYYGFGVSETVLGKFLRNRKDLTITTKVGLYPPGASHDFAWKVLMTKIGGKFISSLSKPKIDFSINLASKSLDQSLRKLNRDCIDLLLVHEPDFNLVNEDDWVEWLTRCCEQGKIRDYGIAGEQHKVKKFHSSKLMLNRIIQTRLAIENLDEDHENKVEADIFFGVFTSEISNFFQVAPARVLNIINKKFPKIPIIIGTTRFNHLKENCKTLEAL